MKKIIFPFLVLLLSGVAWAATPTATGVTVVQSTRRLLKVEYTLAHSPAIVMLSVKTNGVAVSGVNFWDVSGDVNTIVTGDGRHDFTWNLRGTPLFAIGHAVNAEISLVCHPLENPPDYLVVNLGDTIATPRYVFANSVEDLVGGLTNNADYWTSKLVMRRIHARNVPWMMGCQPFSADWKDFASDLPHEVTLTNDYWAGVFQFTRGQWFATTSRKCPGQYRFSDRRPVDSVVIEKTDTATESANPALRGDQTDAYRYPNAPHEDSFLGILRTRTGLAFDLPGEAMWEFAARAGTTDEQWGDGSSTSTAIPGRCSTNSGMIGGTWPGASTAGVDIATCEVGTYRANRFGLYEMNGNVGEHCLDWYAEDIRSLGGAINANLGKTLGGADGTLTVKKGGCIGNSAAQCMSARRWTTTIGSGGRAEGFRVFIHSIDPRIDK